MLIFKQPNKWVLASSSPRRIAMFKKFNFNITIQPADIDETPIENEVPTEYALRVAKQKAMAISQKAPAEVLIIAADTMINFKNKIVGKPVSKKHAFEILSKLNGKTHYVHTAVFIHRKNLGDIAFVCGTKVSFFNHSSAIIKKYVATGESMDKSGAYSIEGLGSILVKKIEGSFNNVVGFPIEEFINRCLNEKILLTVK